MIIIAHRGASGYLPEHTIESKILAFGLVSHDLYLNYTSNVADIYPDKKRLDGKYYIIDFTLEELKKLQLTERFFQKNGNKYAKFPKRFPIFGSNFKIHTLEEEIKLISGLNKSMSKNIGIYPEIKYPDFHLNEGKDISKFTLDILYKYNYRTKSDKIYLQSFDRKELKRIKQDLFLKLNINLKLIQLIGQDELEEKFIDYKGQNYQRNANYDKLLTKEGINKISEYADGVGLHFSMIINKNSKKNNVKYNDILNFIRENKLQSHIYTFRSDPNQIPHYAIDSNDFFNIIKNANIDGIFTDFPDFDSL